MGRMGITEWITIILLVIIALRFNKIVIYMKSVTSDLKIFIVGFYEKDNTHNKKWYEFIWNWVIIINILCVISLLLTVNSTATKSSSSPTYNNENSGSSSEKKCPNCGSTSGSHPHETIPDLKICNTCGVGY